MSTYALSSEAPARAYVKLLIEVHRLIQEGKGDTDEADKVREQMNEPWYEMTDEEQKRLQWLSHDLYALAEGSVQPIAMAPEERARYGSEWGRAYAARDWDRALELLRHPPRDIPLHYVAFIQARIWEHLGAPEAALAFMQAAERLNAQEHAVSVMNLLGQLGQYDEEQSYAERILADPQAPVESLYLAASVLFRKFRELSRSQARPILERLVEVLGRALQAVPAERLLVPGVESFIVCLLGTCHERLGNRRQAEDLYAKALERKPNDHEILALRGILLQPSNPQAALTDFAQAARAGSQSVWPHFFLAGHALLEGRYHDAWQLCNKALQLRGRTPQIEAQLHEWLGLAQAALGQPMEIIRDRFAQALELDPANERRIRFNETVALKKRTGGSPQIDLQAVRPSAQLYIEAQQERVQSQQSAFESLGLFAA